MRPRSEPAPHRSVAMKLKRLTRAGVIALALTALAGLGLATAPMLGHSAAFAQAQAPATTPAPAATPAPPPPPPPPAAPAAAATPPACDAKTLTKCTVNTGDTAWMLTSVALVLM